MNLRARTKRNEDAEDGGGGISVKTMAIPRIRAMPLFEGNGGTFWNNQNDLLGMDVLTRCPKAVCGHRYPCPNFVKFLFML